MDDHALPVPFAPVDRRAILDGYMKALREHQPPIEPSMLEGFERTYRWLRGHGGPSREAVEGMIRELGYLLVEAPDFAPGLAVRGYARQRIGLRDAAIRDFDDALAIDDKLAEAHYGLAALLRGTERDDEAAEHLARVVELGHADVDGIGARDD